MSLRFVFGGSGAGKSTYVFEEVIRQAVLQPQRQFIVMVPDQFTMSTQKMLCSMHPSGGIMNIDVQSFSRLIHRIADEVGTRERTQLDDTGKNLILRSVALQKQDELTVLAAKLKRPGYIHEVKSMISEFYQYAISPADLEEMIELSQGKGSLSYKLRDLKILYEGFQEYISQQYITTEEALEELCAMIPRSVLLAGCDIVVDGFTGFTPIQCKVLFQLMQTAAQMTITLCADTREDILTAGNDQKLFALSQRTYSKLCAMADKEHIEVTDSVFLSQKPVARYAQQPELAFLEANLFRYSGRTFAQQPEKIRVYEADTLVGEVQQICLAIKELIRGSGCYYRDIAVVTGDLGRYAHIVEREFERYQIPYFMDQSRSVTYHPMTEYLLGALNLLKKRFSYESVFRFLRCGMSDITMDEADRLEQYVRRIGIRGRQAYERRFVRGDDAAQMDAVRVRLMDELAPVLGTMKTAGDYVKALYGLSLSSKLQEKCLSFAREFEEAGDMSAAKEYEKIYPACMDLLNQIYELVGAQQVTQEEFVEIFEAGISEIRIGTIPQNVDQVVVGDIERSRLDAVKALFFMGVNDGVIPGKGSGGGFLSDMEREFLIRSGREMAPSPRQQIFEQRLYLYQNMTKPTQRLYLSYSRMDGSGRQALPSYLIRELKGLFPALSVMGEDDFAGEGILSQIASLQDGLDDYAGLMRCYMNGEVASGTQQEQAFLETLQVACRAYRGEKQSEKLLEAALLHYVPQKLEKSITDLLYREHGKGSISRLEQFAACGYAHFLRYGLGLLPRREYEFAAVDFGTVYHAVLDAFFRSLQSSGRQLVDLSEDKIVQMTQEALDETAREYADVVLYSSGRNMYRISQMKQVLVRSLLTMRHQLAKGNFSPAYFERPFSVKGEFELIGKIDRVDLCEDGERTYVKVIDYKSGTKTFDESELYYGLSLQLPLYLYAAVQQVSQERPGSDVVPASMLYYSLRNLIVKEQDLGADEDVEAAVCQQMRMDGRTLDDAGVIAGLDRQMGAQSDVIKVKKNKDGSYSKSSQLRTKEEMDACLAFAVEKSRQLMRDIMDGDIAVNPVQIEGSRTDSCTYCPYLQICRFDPRIPGYEKAELTKVSGDVIKEEMGCS